MKKLKVDEEVLKGLFTEKYQELMKETNLPTSFTIQINPSVKLTGDFKVKVVFKEKAFKKMWSLIDNCSKEVGWHGIVNQVDEKRFEIEDIVIFPQYVTSTTVTPDDEEYTRWLIQFASEHPDDFGRMRFHGHSHVNMGVTPSGVDTDYQKNLTQDIPDFYIFAIFNKKRESWFNIWDIENNVLYEREDIEYMYEPDENEQWADKALKECVKERKVENKTTTAVSTVSSKSTTDKKDSKNTGKDYDPYYDEEYEGWYGNYYRNQYGYDGYGKKNKGKKGYGGYNYE